MRAIARFLTAMWLLTAMPFRSSAQARHAADVAVVQIGQATRMLDLGRADVTRAPNGWTTASFDDADWTPAMQVPDSAQRCVTATYPGWDSAVPAFFGANQADNYLFRQSFSLPAARDYTGSTAYVLVVYAGGTYPQGGASWWLNGHMLHEAAGSDLMPRWSIDSYLQPGNNVFAVYSTGNGGCSGLTFRLAVQLNEKTTTQAPRSSAQQVTTELPGPGVALTGTPIVPFAWKPFPGAADYLLQLWLARATPGQRLVATARVNIAATVAATHYELSTARMPRGSYRWRIAALNAQGTLISTWSPESTVTLG